MQKVVARRTPGPIATGVHFAQAVGHRALSTNHAVWVPARPGRLEKSIAFALPLPLLEQRANASIPETRSAEGPNLDSLRLRYARPHDRRCSRGGGGGAMPVHPGKARTGGLLSASGHCARRKAQARAHGRPADAGNAAAHETR